MFAEMIRVLEMLAGYAMLAVMVTVGLVGW